MKFIHTCAYCCKQACSIPGLKPLVSMLEHRTGYIILMTTAAACAAIYILYVTFYAQQLALLPCMTNFTFRTNISKEEKSPIANVVYKPEQIDVEEYQTFIHKFDKQRYAANLNAGIAWNLHITILIQIHCNTKVRIGTINDGGKWVCNPWRVRPNCVVYSLGILNDVSFDSEFQNLFGLQKSCSIVGVDSHASSEGYYTHVPKGSFTTATLSALTNAANNQYSLIDLFKKFNHTQIDILKMDIEAAEYEVLSAFFKQNDTARPSICQILIELHTINGAATPQYAQLLNLFEANDYWLYSFEVNVWGALVNNVVVYAAEYCYIHQSCLEQFGLPTQPFLYNFPRTTPN